MKVFACLAAGVLVALGVYIVWERSGATAGGGRGAERVAEGRTGVAESAPKGSDAQPAEPAAEAGQADAPAQAIGAAGVAGMAAGDDDHHHIIRSYTAQLSPSLREVARRYRADGSARFVLPLFDGREITVTVDSFLEDGPDGGAVTGVVEGSEGSFITLGFVGEAEAGAVHLPESNEVYEIRPATGGAGGGGGDRCDQAGNLRHVPTGELRVEGRGSRVEGGRRGRGMRETGGVSFIV
jgi:hypothetical protein